MGRTVTQDIRRWLLAAEPRVRLLVTSYEIVLVLGVMTLKQVSLLISSIFPC
jgi:hypothetical protein